LFLNGSYFAIEAEQSIEFLTFASDTTGHGVPRNCGPFDVTPTTVQPKLDREEPNPDALGVDVLEKATASSEPAPLIVQSTVEVSPTKPSVGSSSVTVTSLSTPGASTSGPPYSQTFWSVWRTRRAIGAVASLQMSSNGWS
jgi:hypothetical protein